MRAGVVWQTPITPTDMDNISQQLLRGSPSLSEPGQQTFTASGSFTVPLGITSISCIAVGRGGSGGSGYSDENGYYGGGGGGGGALSYLNAIPVTPGETLTVTLDYLGIRLLRGSSVLVSAAHGMDGIGGRTQSPTGGTGGSAAYSVGSVKYSGGNGGNGGVRVGGSGGGAAGYAGNGGAGGGIGQPASSGAGGGGGGGSQITRNFETSGAGGGGVGLLGQGSNGIAVATQSDVSPYTVTGGGGGSNGTSAADVTPGNWSSIGGTYGGGAGGASPDFSNSRAGGPGAVRIIWPGDLRQFPSTRTTDE